MIHVHTLQQDYAQICRTVLAKGEETSPRGKRTRELLATTICVVDTTRSLPLHVGRGCNPAVGAVEAVQLAGGFSDPELTVKIAPNMQEFLTAERYFHGAYGPRFKPQLASICATLKRDSDTRQAVATIWNPVMDLGARQPDLPCTVSLHFLIRRDKLVLHTHMRSNDVWWGLAYDVFQFTQLQHTVANMLGIMSGAYYHHTTSLHIYERDWDSVGKLHPPTELMPDLWGFLDDDRAWKIGHGMVVPCPSATEQWYQRQLGPHILG